MKVNTTAAAACFLAASASAQNSTAACATGLHLIVARGSTEPPGTGRIGSVANGVVALVPGSEIEPIVWPATLDNYASSVEEGTTAMKAALTQYNARCPNSKVALLGYSQGAHVVGDALCGNTEDDRPDTELLNFAHTTPVPASVVDQSVVAVILFGDPTHNISDSWNKGTSKHDGLFPRKNITACAAYAPKIESYCDTGDVYCDVGTDKTVHGSYFANYTNDAVEFVVSKFNVSSHFSNGTLPPTTVPYSGADVSAPGMLMSLVGLAALATALL